MPIRTYKPTSPGRRNSQARDFSEITRSKPHKPLLRPKRRSSGRNSRGVITARHRGGGAKRHYRIIDFKRRKDAVPAVVESIEYDPNRSARIALVCYRDGERRYILAPRGLKVGTVIFSGERVEARVGNCMPLASIPLGMTVHNVEMTPGRGGQLARSAGTGRRAVRPAAAVNRAASTSSAGARANGTGNRGTGRDSGGTNPWDAASRRALTSMRN